MQYFSNLLAGMNPFSITPYNRIVKQAKCEDTSPGTFSSLVTGTISISKMIFDKSFDSHILNIPLPFHADIWKVIFSTLNFKDLQACSLTSRECYKLANDPVFSKGVVFNEFCFNPSHWNKYCGDGTVSTKEIEKALQLLPPNINEILKSPCPVFPDQRIMDSHILVWIPETINGKALTIENLGKLLKLQTEFSSNLMGYRSWDNTARKDGFESVKSGWILMTTHILPDSRNKSYIEQQGIVVNLNKSGQTDYRLPKAGEVIVCIIAEYLRSKKRLFDGDDGKNYTYTRCQEIFGDNQVAVGGFESRGLRVAAITSDYHAVGVACILEL